VLGLSVWVAVLVLLSTGCGVRVAQLPEISHPYVAKMEFLKEVKNVDGKAKKTRFNKNRIETPFDFYLEIKEIEDEGTVSVVFYSAAMPEGKETLPLEKKIVKAAERSFEFGESGKYYEYIIFFDSIGELKPGLHRYAIFLRKNLLYEGQVEIF